MAKAQTIKPKSSFGDWFRRLGSPKPKPAPARPMGTTTSTATRVPAAGGPATRPGSAARAAAPAAPRQPAKPRSGGGLAGFRMPFIGAKPVTTQLQILGVAALLLLAGTAFVVYQDTTLRTRHATYLTIASEMQFHTQRLAKAAGIAARGQAIAFPQLKASRDQFAAYLGVLRNGGQAFDVNLPPAGADDLLRARLDELAKRWPESANASTAILGAQDDLISLSKNIAQIRVGAEEMATMSQELTGLMTQSGSPPAQVVKANRLTFLAERLGRGSAEILGSETIDPEVPFLIGKDTNDLRDLIKSLESGNDAAGIAALRDPDARAMLSDLKKQFAQFEKNVSPILRELQKLVSARQASAQLVTATEQLQGSVAQLQTALASERPVAALVGVAVLASLLVVVLLLMAAVFLADTRRRAAEAEAENKRNQEAILRLLNEMGDLADGDLTIRAQVTEDITGAIADSMNYTIDELRTLVAGVSNAATQVTQKTAHAQSISAELLGAAERQSKEIEETTAMSSSTTTRSPTSTAMPRTVATGLSPCSESCSFATLDCSCSLPATSCAEAWRADTSFCSSRRIGLTFFSNWPNCFLRSASIERVSLSRTAAMPMDSLPDSSARISSRRSLVSLPMRNGTSGSMVSEPRISAEPRPRRSARKVRRLAFTTCAGGEPDCVMRPVSSCEAVAMSEAPMRICAMLRESVMRSFLAFRIAVAAAALSGQRLARSSRRARMAGSVAAGGSVTSNAVPPFCSVAR